MCAHTCAEHRVPTPKRLFPERLAPGEYPVLDHPLVSAPHVVDENVDPARLLSNALEGSRHLSIHSVVAANAGDAPIFINECAIADRAAGDEHPRPAAPERACDAAANAEGPTGDDGDLAFEGFHGSTYSESQPNCSGLYTLE